MPDVEHVGPPLLEPPLEPLLELPLELPPELLLELPPSSPIEPPASSPLAPPESSPPLLLPPVPLLLAFDIGPLELPPLEPPPAPLLDPPLLEPAELELPELPEAASSPGSDEPNPGYAFGELHAGMAAAPTPSTSSLRLPSTFRASSDMFGPSLQ